MTGEVVDLRLPMAGVDDRPRWHEQDRRLAGIDLDGVACLLIDLRDVTFIDESGEGLLGEMREQGAEFVARGVVAKHLLESLKDSKPS